MPGQNQREVHHPMSQMILQTLYDNLRARLLPVCSSQEQATAEARLLLEGALEIDAQLLYVDPQWVVPPAALAKAETMAQDRIERRIPMQYLLHRAWFHGLPLYVNPAVLIPRPETEHLVEVALAMLREQPPTAQPFQVLDFGTGSGAIALALAKSIGSAGEVSATDLSQEALQVAAINAKSLKLPIRLLPFGDGFSTIPSGHSGFDLIVSNPPYIDQTLRDTLAPEVLWHEPSMALFPPSEDAYLFYRRLAIESPKHLKAGGHLLVEVGAGQAPTVAALFQEAGFESPQIHLDYAGIERVVGTRLNTF
jgi:release factor glutamine methyltransferase